MSSSHLQFGGWSRPQKYGLGRLTFFGTITVLTGIILTIMSIPFGGVKAGLIIGALTAIMAGLVGIQDHNFLTPSSRAYRRINYMIARKLFQTSARFGPIAKKPKNQTALPGLAGKIGIEEHDGYTLITGPKPTQYALPLISTPDGDSLVDQDQINNWVAGFGHFLSDLSLHDSMSFAQIIIETIPDNASGIRASVNAKASDHASALSRAIFYTLTHPQNASSIATRAWIVLSFTTPKKRVDLAKADLGARIKEICGALSAAGASNVRPATTLEILANIRTSYNLEASDILDELGAAGQEIQIPLNQAGPIATENQWGSYLHDDAISKSWICTTPPQGVVYDTTLKAILAPHKDLKRKRVALLYRPIPAEKAAQIIDRDLKNAATRLSAGQSGQARKQKALQDARARAAEEAQGASLIRFAMVITATAPATTPTATLDAAIGALAARSRLTIRVAYAMQDAAFIQTLPLGIDVAKEGTNQIFDEIN